MEVAHGFVLHHAATRSPFTGITNGSKIKVRHVYPFINRLLLLCASATSPCLRAADWLNHFAPEMVCNFQLFESVRCRKCSLVSWIRGLSYDSSRVYLMRGI